MKKALSKEELKILRDLYYHYRDDDCLNKLYSTKQHRTSNTYRHVCLVAKLTIRHVIKHKLHYDYSSLIRGAFLHDYFFYDWRKDKENRKKHLKLHPQRALKNAEEIFHLTPTEIDIISNHMWPITITKFPKTKEGRLIMWEDKVATMIEVFSKKKDTIIFDMEGTILDTIKDLKESVNHTLTKFGYSAKTQDEVRKAIGNGLKILMKRLLPKDISENQFTMIYTDFYDYYSKHFADNTKPYDDLYEQLVCLRRKGYKLAVSTNKDEKMAKDLCEQFYPNIFLSVVGNDGKSKGKPNPDSIIRICKELKVRNKRKIIYIGDSEVDYQTAKNANIECYLVTYGYRTKEELIEQGIVNTEFIFSPKDLNNIF